MKKIALVLSALLAFASPSFAGGVFADGTTVSSASGDANVPANLVSGINLPGGAITKDNAVRLSGRFSAVGAPATFAVKIGNVTLTTYSLPANANADWSVTVWRESATAGGWRFDGSSTEGYSNGFSWGSQQSVQVVGTSTGEGGALLQRIFVER